MKVNLELSRGWQGLISPEKVEKKYNVKFVCETQLKNKFGWRDQSSLIFYGEKHPQGSNYMAISGQYGVEGELEDLVITDGISATQGCFVGVIDENIIYYSRFRHDMRFTPSGSFIDGGRDYVRSTVVGSNKLVDLEIVDGVLRVKE